MFQETICFKKLISLSQNPPDLTRELTPKRIEEMEISALGFKLLYAAERVSPLILEALYALAEERGARKQMMAMQTGEQV